MKKATPATPAATPVAFDEKTAVACAPTRHDATGRTFCFRQPDGGKHHLFSATRDFVATVDGKLPEPAEAAK